VAAGWVSRLMGRASTARRADPDVVLLDRPIERLAADLRRLGEESCRLRADPGISARAFHLHVAELAYDDTLLLACRALEVETGAVQTPLPAIRRLELEAELARRGLQW